VDDNDDDNDDDGLTACEVYSALLNERAVQPSSTLNFPPSEPNAQNPRRRYRERDVTCWASSEVQRSLCL